MIFSQEGTTQGDPLAMPFFALATLPLISKLSGPAEQTGYADDAAATGKIADLHEWWNEVSCLGPCYGYHANASKTWLVTKEEFLSEATAVFGDTSVQVTTEGRPYLGAPLGSPAYVSQFVREKVDQWSKELSLLSQIANTQPHAAFAAYTRGMQSRWSYLSTTTPLIGGHLQELEHLLRSRLIPNLTGRSPPSDAERNLFALPARFGGLGITVPSLESDLAFCASLGVTAPLRELFNSHDHVYSSDTLAKQTQIKSELRPSAAEQAIASANDL